MSAARPAARDGLADPAEAIRSLAALGDEAWIRYAFARDPLVGRLSAEERLAHGSAAIACGIAEARRLRAEYPGASPSAIAAALGVGIVVDEKAAGGDLFASYAEGGAITVYAANARAADGYVAAAGLADLTGGVGVAEALVAHELFHHFESVDPELYTARRHLTLWKLGPLVRRSAIPCLGELGAMAFAKELSGLRCSAFILNALMLAPTAPEAAIRFAARAARYGNASDREETR